MRATAVGVHVSGSGGSSPGPLLHQLLHLQTPHRQTVTQDTEGSLKYHSTSLVAVSSFRNRAYTEALRGQKKGNFGQ